VRTSKIVNALLLASETFASFRLTTRISALVEVGPGMYQLTCPVFGVPENNGAYVTPPSVERSIFTSPEIFFDVHEIVCVVPTCQCSPPFGEVSVRALSLTTGLSLQWKEKSKLISKNANKSAEYFVVVITEFQLLSIFELHNCRDIHG